MPYQDPYTHLLNRFADDAIAHRDAPAPEPMDEVPWDDEIPIDDPDYIHEEDFDWDEGETADDWLSGLDEHQRKAATATERVVYVIAGPGAGKTRVITHRLRWLESEGFSGDRLKAYTFTKDATGEMRKRLFSMGGHAQISTLHALSRALIKHDVDTTCGLAPVDGFQLSRKPGFKFFGKKGEDRDETEGESYIHKVVSRYGLPNIKDYGKEASYYVSAISRKKAFGEYPKMTAEQAIDEISRAADFWDKIQKMQERSTFRIDARSVAKMVDYQKPDWVEIVYALYQQELIEANVYDFDDQVIVSRFIAERHPEMTCEFLSPTVHMLVDEFQDTSFQQYAMLSAMLKADPGLRLYCVGDDDQCIYGWRGANVENVHLLTEEHDATHYLLPINYRSVPEIVDYSQRLIRQCDNRIEKNLRAHRESEDRFGVSHGVGSPAVNLGVLRNAGLEWKDMAVISRTWSELDSLAKHCEREEIPFACKRFQRIEDTAFARDMKAIMQFLSGGEVYEGTVKRFVKMGGPFKGYGKKFWDAWPGCMDTDKGRPLKQWQASNPFHPACSMSDWLGWFLRSKFYVRHNTSKFLDRMEIMARQVQTAGRFLERMDAEIDGGVVLTSAHSAKGLEWPAVIVLNGEFSCQTDEDIRTHYVAVTRAESRLLLT